MSHLFLNLCQAVSGVTGFGFRTLKAQGKRKRSWALKAVVPVKCKKVVSQSRSEWMGGVLADLNLTAVDFPTTGPSFA